MASAPHRPRSRRAARAPAARFWIFRFPACFAPRGAQGIFSPQAPQANRTAAWACGGTAEACGAIVVGGDGSMKHYCSYCGESTKFPIDGICKSAKGSNTCENGVCAHCAANYFLYMGGLLQCVERARPPHVQNRYEWHMHSSN